MPTSKEKLEKILLQVDTKAAELAALKPLKPEDGERLWKKFRLEWNYNSNHIEGNTLTYSETQLLLLFDQTPTEPHTLRELEEMKAHDVAVLLIRQWAEDKSRDLTEADIRSLNETILVRPFWKEAVTPDGQPTRRLISVGEYKQQPNSVRLSNGEMFHYTAPEAVQREMGELMDWYRNKSAALHPVIAAALLHYRFVRIHPFDDGNGRISRLLLNYQLLRHGFPPIVIKSADKQHYLFALQQADVGDLDAFCVYVAEQLLWSLELSIRAAKGETVEELGDWEKEVALLLRNAEVVRKDEKSEKIDREEKLAEWLRNNFQTLWKIFTRHFEPFNSFFETAGCSAFIKYSHAEVSFPLGDGNEDWLDISKGIFNGRYLPQIIFSYHFEGFLYAEDKIHPVLEEPSFFIEIAGNHFRFDGETWPVSPLHKLSDTDLQPIRNLAEKLKKQIEWKLMSSDNEYF